MASPGDPSEPAPGADARAPADAPSAAAPSPAAKPTRRRGRRWPHAVGLLGYSALAIGLPLAAGWALLNRPEALPMLLRLAPGVQASGVDGTLAGGRIRIASLDLTLPSQLGRLQLTDVALDGLALRRAPHAGAWLALHWQALSADQARWTSGPPSAKPAPPTDLQLPLVLDALPVKLNRLQVDQLPALGQLSARVSLGADAGKRHRLTDLAFSLPQAHVRGTIAIATQAPLPLQADLALQGRSKLPWQATLGASGPLAKLELQARLTGEAPPKGTAPSLSAQATVAPWLPWPLQALTLGTQALDLAALSPQWPHTALDGRASVQTQGLKAPVLVSANIDNRLPGSLDSGRVPLRQLRITLRGDAEHTDRLGFDQFDLLLGDAQAAAGRITGQGRWQADRLDLTLNLDAVQPARLNARAAALEISGPLALQLQGLPTRSPGAATATASTPGPTASAPAANPLKALQVAAQATLAGRALDGSGLPVKITLVGEGSANQVLIKQAEASAGDARAAFALDARRQPTGWQIKGDAKLSRFDPLPWWRGGEGTVWRRGPHRLNADVSANLLWRGAPPDGLALDRLLQAVEGQASVRLADSVLAGVPLSGDWQLRSQGNAVQVQADSLLAGNQVKLNGQGGGAPDKDRWQVDVQAPSLATLGRLRALALEIDPDLGPWWPQDGNLQGSLQVEGRWPNVRTTGDLRAQALKAPAFALQQVGLAWRTGDGAEAPLMLRLDARGLQGFGQTVDRLQADASGNLRQHNLHFQLDSPVRPPAWTETLLGPAGSGTRLEGQARGQWARDGTGANTNTGSTWRLKDLQLQGGARDAQGGSRPWLASNGLSAEVKLDADANPQSLKLDPGRLQLLTTALNWREALWQAGGSPGKGRLTVQAELETIDVARLLQRVQPDLGWGGNLTLGGHIDIRSAERFDADVVLERGGGDLTLTDDLGVTQVLGISDLRLALSAHDGLWQFAQGMAGTNVGEMAGAQVLRTTADRRWPDASAPLQGVLEARVANLGIWGTWVPPGWRLGGNLRTTATFGGTAGAPELRGEMRGSGLALRNVLQGVNISDGELAINLGGEQAQIERAVFKGGDGLMTVTGGATLGASPSLQVQLVADRFRLLGRIDRRIVASGQASLQLDAQRVKLDGKLAVDEGQIDISHGSAPTLDNDVVLHDSRDGANDRPVAATSPLPTPLRNAQINLAIDLGQKLRLRGRGVDTTLRGQLTATSPGGRLALVGTVHGDGGTFAAYGQNLDISRGDLVFTGAADNPRLDVQATRPNLDVVVGVAITGNALGPRVRLFSEPELAEYDKLSWLVLGRSPDGLGRTDTALLQRAALALLAGDGKAPTDELLNALGLTDFSVRQTEGTVRETVVSLGRQLSRRWYLGYERSVNATTGTWQLVYRVAQRFTLRAQSGSENALDAIWSWRW